MGLRVGPRRIGVTGVVGFPGLREPFGVNRVKRLFRGMLHAMAVTWRGMLPVTPKSSKVTLNLLRNFSM